MDTGKKLNLIQHDSGFVGNFWQIYLIGGFMTVDVALRDGDSFEISRIELEVENGVPIYPDCVVCSETQRVWWRSTSASQGKARYDLVRSNWSPIVTRVKS